MAVVAEGKARIGVRQGKVSRALPVFYNPAMKLNRDVSVLLVKSVDKRNMRIADPLAASGVRGIRFLMELPKSKVEELMLNDISASAVRSIRRNLKLNRLNISKKAVVANEEANIFLLKNRPFDYVDIDPFGSPVPFLDSAAKAVANRGILAVTATDTAALSGTAPKACLRKYHSFPLKNYLMHELGLRILIRRVQLAGASNGKALVPTYSYSKLHYMRVFLCCTTRAGDIDAMLRQHRFVRYCKKCLTAEFTEKFDMSCSSCNGSSLVAGPMWAGSLWDSRLASAISKSNGDEENEKFLKIVVGEAKITAPFFYDTHVFAERFRLEVPQLNAVIRLLKKRGFKAARTHLTANGIRTNAPARAFSNAMKMASV